MADLYEVVLHHLKGRETEIQNWETSDGINTVNFQSFGPDRWIERVYERGRMTGIDCLAIILFALDESLFDPEPARRIVEGWAAELRKSVSTNEIQARDRVTLLALEQLPDGWDWLISIQDANQFIAARGMEWRFDEVVLQLFKQFEQAIQNRRFPPSIGEATRTRSPQTHVPTVAIAAPDGVTPELGWSLKTSLTRAPGYRWPLYQVLKAAHIAGQACPTPREVLDVWKLNPPPEVQVMSDGVKYNNGLGNPKEANLKAIQQAIKALLN